MGKEYTVCPKCNEINTAHATMCVNCYNKLGLDIINPKPVDIKSIHIKEDKVEKRTSLLFRMFFLIVLLVLFILLIMTVLMVEKTVLDIWSVLWRYIVGISLVSYMWFSNVNPDVTFFLTGSRIMVNNPEPSDYYYFMNRVETVVIPLIVVGYLFNRYFV